MCVSHLEHNIEFELKGITRAMLNDIAVPLTSYPAKFTPHRIVAKLLQERRAALQATNGELDWAAAEAMVNI